MACKEGINDMCNAIKFLSILFFLLFGHFVFAEEDRRCKALDVREYGLINSTSLLRSWTEAELILKYGPPCDEIHIGLVYIERGWLGRIWEVELRFDEKGAIDKKMEIVEKKQLIYWGDYSNKTTVVTIVGGVVIGKERLDE